MLRCVRMTARGLGSGVRNRPLRAPDLVPERRCDRWAITTELGFRARATQLFCAPAATHALMSARSAAGIFGLPSGIAPLDSSLSNCDVFDSTLA